MPDATEAVTALAGSRLRAATAESLTGGTIAAALTAVAGSSAVFAGAVVAYDIAAKQNLLGVPASLLRRNGPVDPAVAAWMALGACRALGVDCAVSTTGAAGPLPHGGARPGTVYLGWRIGPGQGVIGAHLAGDRARVRSDTTRLALSLLTECARGGAVSRQWLQAAGNRVSDSGVTIDA